jgi:predicted dehydrogenase
MDTNLNRRGFLKAGAAIAALGTLPSAARSASPNGQLRTAHIGVGGMGGSDLNSISTHPQVEVAALCDVDLARLNSAQNRHPHAKTFRDYREMLAELGDKVDAVVVSTPDHTHAPAAMTALNLGKPVYCQKPLTHEVFEARQLRLAAAKQGVPTQMGIQVHSSEVYRRAVAMIQSGVIGKVSQVHAWSHKNWGYDGGAPTGEHKVPDTLEWDLWIGTAEKLPFTPSIYHPGQWRKMIPFGTGTLGDMGVHIFDTPYAALQLTFPKWARTTCRPPTDIGHPEKNIVEYEFPGTDFTTDALLWNWYDGAFAPPTDLQLPPGLELPQQGSFFVGKEGMLLLPHVGEAQLFPQEKFSDYMRPQVEPGNHYHQWVDACLGDGETSADFGYAGLLTEALLLGVVANRFPGEKLVWDAENLRVVNVAAANKLLRRQYRKGFETEGL